MMQDLANFKFPQYFSASNISMSYFFLNISESGPELRTYFHRGKKILEQISKPSFFMEFEKPAIFKLRKKKRDFERYSNIVFPLVRYVSDPLFCKTLFKQLELSPFLSFIWFLLHPICVSTSLIPTHDISPREINSKCYFETF